MTLIQPHGGQLIDRHDPDYDVTGIEKSIEIDDMALSDLELIGVGAYSPITGFLNKKDYQSVVERMKLSTDEPWSIPIQLPISEEVARTLKIGETIKLSRNDVVYGVIEVEEIFTQNKTKEAENVYQTTELAHPGVKKLFDRDDVYLAGPVTLIKRVVDGEFVDYYYKPKETREAFADDRKSTSLNCSYVS